MRGAIGKPPVTRLALLGRKHQAPDLRKQGRAVCGGHLDLERIAQIERPGIDLLAGRHGRRLRLASDQALVDLAGSGQDHAVGRDSLAGGNEQTVAGAKRLGGHQTARSAILDDRGNPALQAQQILRLATGADPQALVQPAADEEEEQKRHGGVEIDLLVAANGLVKAHRRRQQDGKRDRHIHVEPAPTQSLKRRGEEGLAGIGDRG